ncbi:hypothetical protein [Rodentibacter trehalosifermentans]|uniref:hypothetical protein n=1 Tax=Rodentibacter trehalosifermentans TaxID=1908263 RepID=UPI0009849B00|nr:hypothetical protein [Rodentibacter trehalosifermentans]OOF52329.1 hypothetical protein BKK53_05865 [Rodentibacter trehalosifermentans]
MRFIIGVLINIIIFSLLYFFAIYYVKTDANIRDINYLNLIEEAISASLKFHLIIIPIIFLTSKKKK